MYSKEFIRNFQISNFYTCTFWVACTCNFFAVVCILPGFRSDFAALSRTNTSRDLKVVLPRNSCLRYWWREGLGWWGLAEETFHIMRPRFRRDTFWKSIFYVIRFSSTTGGTIESEETKLLTTSFMYGDLLGKHIKGWMTPVRKSRVPTYSYSGR